MAEEVKRDRGLRGAVMNALWPFLGGDMMPADVWHDIDAAVGEALATAEADIAALRDENARLRTDYVRMFNAVSVAKREISNLGCDLEDIDRAMQRSTAPPYPERATMTDPAQIAKELNPLSKRDLIDLCNGVHRPSLDVFCLILMGLVDYRRRYWLFGEKIVTPTRLGRAVRAILTNGGNHD